MCLDIYNSFIEYRKHGIQPLEMRDILIIEWKINGQSRYIFVIMKNQRSKL